MANVSDWKGFEKMVAAELGGKRRLRTMESFGKVATDVYFPKKVRKRFPRVKQVAIECKKRKSMNLHAIMAEAKMKYGKEGKKRVILASKVTHKRNLRKRIDEMKSKTERFYEKKLIAQARLLRKHPKRKKKLRSLAKRFQKELDRKIEEREIQLRLRHDITALVTVELSFFRELWEAWAYESSKSSFSKAEAIAKW